jgi:hypothetical protein
MSELMNGVRPFSRDDIVVIHRLFHIEFNRLDTPFLEKGSDKSYKKYSWRIKKLQSPIKI